MMRSLAAVIGLAGAWCLAGLAATPARPADLPGGSGPAPARGSEGRLLVVNNQDDSLMVFDVPSNALLATVRVGDEPHEVAVTPDGRKAYVSNLRGGNVTVVDLRRYQVAGILKPDRVDRPHGMAITPDGRRLLLTSEGSRRLYLIETRRDVVEKVVTMSQSGGHLVTLARNGSRAWIANRDSDSVSLYDLPAMRLIRTVRVGPGPEGIAVSPNGRWVVTVLRGAGQVAVIDERGGQVVTRLPAGQSPIRLAFPPRAPIALVANRDSDDVTVLDLAARQVLRTVPVGGRPAGLTTNQRGTRAYVCNNASGSVSIVSLPGYEVVGTIEAGRGPDGIAFLPAAPPAPARPSKQGTTREKGA